MSRVGRGLEVSKNGDPTAPRYKEGASRWWPNILRRISRRVSAFKRQTGMLPNWPIVLERMSLSERASGDCVYKVISRHVDPSQGLTDGLTR